jgi:hypothetical protein
MNVSLAHIGKVATTRATHYKATAALSLSKINGSYLKAKEKTNKLSEKLAKVTLERDAAQEKVRALTKELDRLKQQLRPVEAVTPVMEKKDEPATVKSTSSPSTLSPTSRRRKASRSASPQKQHVKSASTPPSTQDSFINLEAELEDAMSRGFRGQTPLLKVKPEFSNGESSVVDVAPVPPLRTKLRPLQLAATSARMRSGSLPTSQKESAMLRNVEAHPGKASSVYSRRPSLDAIPSLHRTASYMAMGSSLEVVNDLLDSYKTSPNVVEEFPL